MCPPGSGVASRARAERPMRILVTNPDTIGDTVLRQPLLGALLAAGHEVLVMCRPVAAPVISLIAPVARLFVVDAKLYDLALSAEDRSLDAAAAAAREFDPEVLLVGPYQWTILEERLSVELPGARRIAMSGRVYADEAFGPARASTIRIDERVEVGEFEPELVKNARLAAAVLGGEVVLPDPRLEPTEEMLAAARKELEKFGLEPGGYWAAAIQPPPWAEVRNWRPERWAQTLREWSGRHGRRFLLIGDPSEREGTLRTRALIGEDAESVPAWFGGDGLFGTLVGLLALSGGYFGRDTGPMHIAAALGRPVLAVFGGGTWPRFLPAVAPSVAVTVGVPCAGCRWRCHLPESVCVKDVPVEAVLEAAEALEAGGVTDRETRVLPPGERLLMQIGLDGALAARTHMARAGEAERQLKRKGREVELQKQAVETMADRLVRDAAEANARAGRAEQQADQMRRELEQARARVAELEAAAVENVKARAQHVALLSAAKEDLTEAEAKVAWLERRLQERAQEGVALRGELEAARAELAKRQAEAADLRAKLRAVHPEEQRAREAKLQEQLAKALSELSRWQADVSDLRVRIERSEKDRTVLGSRAKAQEAELAVLRTRLNELMASRWRRLGQRLGVAMTLPWEREAVNGKR